MVRTRALASLQVSRKTWQGHHLLGLNRHPQMLTTFHCHLLRFPEMELSSGNSESLLSACDNGFAASDSVDGAVIWPDVRRENGEKPPASLEEAVSVGVEVLPRALAVCLCVLMLLLFLLGLFLDLFLRMVSMRRCGVMMECRICRCYSVAQILCCLVNVVVRAKYSVRVGEIQCCSTSREERSGKRGHGNGGFERGRLEKEVLSFVCEKEALACGQRQVCARACGSGSRNCEDLTNVYGKNDLAICIQFTQTRLMGS